VLAHRLAHEALQRHARFVDLANLVERMLIHQPATPAIDNKPLGRQALEAFADGGAADLQTLGDLFFNQAFIRAQHAVHDV